MSIEESIVSLLSVDILDKEQIIVIMDKISEMPSKVKISIRCDDDVMEISHNCNSRTTSMRVIIGYMTVISATIIDEVTSRGYIDVEGSDVLYCNIRVMNGGFILRTLNGSTRLRTTSVYHIENNNYVLISSLIAKEYSVSLSYVDRRYRADIDSEDVVRISYTRGGYRRHGKLHNIQELNKMTSKLPSKRVDYIEEVTRLIEMI